MIKMPPCPLARFCSSLFSSLLNLHPINSSRTSSDHSNLSRIAHQHMFLALFHHRKPKTPAPTPRSHHNSLSPSALVDETPRELDTCPTESLRNLSSFSFSSVFIIYHLVILQSMLASQSLPIRTLFAAMALPQFCSALSHGSSSLAAFLRVSIPCLCNKVAAPRCKRGRPGV